jgi:hypothetical protein
VPRDTVFLSDLPGDVVWLVCDKCGRGGRYRIAGLTEKLGAAARLIYVTQSPNAQRRQTQAGRSTSTIYERHVG